MCEREYEVELKVRAEHGPVWRRLSDLGADRIGRVVQADTYYDAPHRAFAETDEALRLRREERADGDGGGEDGEGVRLTYKGPLVDDASKTRAEFETGVDDGEAAADILGELGFEPAAVVEKERERFRLEGYAVALDDVSGLGEFVEVERAAAAADVDAVREGAVAVLERLGLDPDDAVRTSYLGLLDAGE